MRNNHIIYKRISYEMRLFFCADFSLGKCEKRLTLSGPKSII